MGSRSVISAARRIERARIHSGGPPGLDELRREIARLAEEGGADASI